MENKYDHKDWTFRTTRKKSKTWLIVLLSVVLLFVITGMLLPVFVLKYANRQLHDLREYSGNIKGMELHVIRGTYAVNNFVMHKKDENGEKDSIPVVTVPRMDLTLDWPSLRKGKLAAKIIVTEPVVNFTYEIQKDKEIKQDTMDFKELLDKLVPFSINRFEIRNGQLHYIDESKKPDIRISMQNFNVTATNLSNIENKEKTLPAHVSADAKMYDGNFNLDVDLNPLKKEPTFDMKTEVKNVNLSKFNEMFREYGNFLVKKGTFNLYGEFAGKKGKFGGYVKPFIKDFEVKKDKEDKDLGQRLWVILVGTSMKILENPKTDKVATKIPVNGEFKNANVNIYDAIHYVLRNAFVQALRPTIENSININHLDAEGKKTFLEKVFGGKDEKEKEEKREGKEEEKKK
jgi:hypothetical protein